MDHHHQQQQQEQQRSSHDEASEPKLCANNCGFYGSPSTNNLCSLCFKKQQNTSFENFKQRLADLGQPRTINHTVINAANVCDEESANHPKKVAIHCRSCNKRLTICSVFKCRCGEQLCSVHRYSDKHDCSFDYKSAAQDAIAKANPLIKADKLHDRI